MNEKQQRPDKDTLDGSFAYDQLNKLDSVVSGTECTGLMQRPPEDEDEAESYNEIYVVPRVPNDEEKRLRVNGEQ